jgi:hypothetical protein
LDTITFDDTDIFGKNFSKLKALNHCNISNILEHIELDGKIRIGSNIQVRELWLYIYYLWSHNPNNNMYFIGMSASEGIASAKKFVEYISSYLHFKPRKLKRSHLVRFINGIIEDGKSNQNPIEIPFLSELARIVMEKLKTETTEGEIMYNQLEENLSALKNAVNRSKTILTTIKSEENNLTTTHVDKMPMPKNLVVKIVTNSNSNTTANLLKTDTL